MHDETPPPSSSLKAKRCLDAPNRVLVTNLVVRLMSHIFCYDHMSHEAADEAGVGPVVKIPTNTVAVSKMVKENRSLACNLKSSKSIMIQL